MPKRVKDHPRSEKEILLQKIQTTNSVHDLIEISRHPDPKIRLKSIQQMCPCHVESDIDLFWNRLFEMVTDEDRDVRYQVLHNMCDGSPSHLEADVVKALDKLNYDTDSVIRRKVHQIMGHYSKTGEWNIM